MATEQATEQQLQEYETESNAPPLNGTPRQIAWGRQIRYDWAAAYNIYSAWQGPGARQPERSAYPNADPYVDAAVHRWIIDHQTDAQWWINHRSNGADTGYGKGIYDLYHRTAPRFTPEQASAFLEPTP